MEVLTSVALPAGLLALYLTLSKRARLVAWAALSHPRRDDILIETAKGPKIVPASEATPEEREMAGFA